MPSYTSSRRTASETRAFDDQVLALIKAAGDAGVSTSELAEHFKMVTNDVYPACKRLEAREMVERGGRRKGRGRTAPPQVWLYTWRGVFPKRGPTA